MRIMLLIRTLPFNVMLNPASLEAFCLILSKILIWFAEVIYPSFLIYYSTNEMIFLKEHSTTISIRSNKTLHGY